MWKLSCGEVGLSGGGYFCGPFDAHWEGVSMAMTELYTVANLLHQHPQPWHRLLQGCQWTCCPTLSTKMGVNDKLSDLTQLRYMPASLCSCSPISAVTTCSHMHAVPGVGLAKSLWSHRDPKAFTQPRSIRDVWKALCVCVCVRVHKRAGGSLNVGVRSSPSSLGSGWPSLIWHLAGNRVPDPVLQELILSVII